MTEKEIYVIKNNISQQLKSKEVAPLIIAGKPGTAKSSTIKLLAKELDMHLLDVSCPTLTIEYLSGLPEEYRTPEFDKFNVMNVDTFSTKWSVPELIANANTLSETKPTILLLDDFHMVQPHLQAYFFKLLLERMIGNYKLAANVVIIGTMNDSEEAGMNQINSAVRNRLAILPIEFNFEHWFEGYGKFLHYLVASFLKTKESYISEDESTSIEGYATARAWSAIAAELKGIPYELLPTYAPMIVKTQVGKEAAEAFTKHLLYINAVDFKAIVESKTIINISKLDPLEAVIHSYIPNFINTVSDGIFFLNLLDANHKEEAFIGFTIAEIYNKYISETSEELTDGLNFIINTIVQKPFSKDNYDTITPKEVKAIKELKLKHQDVIMSIASTYLI